MSHRLLVIGSLSHASWLHEGCTPSTAATRWHSTQTAVLPTGCVPPEGNSGVDHKWVHHGRILTTLVLELGGEMVAFMLADILSNVA